MPAATSPSGESCDVLQAGTCLAADSVRQQADFAGMHCSKSSKLRVFWHFQLPRKSSKNSVTARPALRLEECGNRQPTLFFEGFAAMLTLDLQPIRESSVRAGRAYVPAALPPAVTIEQVRTRGQRREFVELPWRIYAGDAGWCPPLKLEAHASIDPAKHPFYKHGKAVQFIARQAGQVVGRISVSDDPNYNAEHDANVGCFGMFETVDDPEVARSLLNAAARWLRGQGRTSIIGPIDYSTNYQAGLLIEGFDTPQRIMMNHHRPYYGELLERWGLKKAKDMYAWWFEANNPALADWTRRAARLAARGGVTIRPVRTDDFDAEIERCLKVYNQTWEKTWGFVQMTPEEFRHTAYQLKQFAVPELLLMAEVAGETIGFCVTLPDMNEAVRPVNGNLTTWGLPIGLVRLLRGMKQIHTARMAVLGVLPGYRKRGIAELMILQAFQYGSQQLGYTGAELGWTLEDNEMINRTVQSVGAQRYKRFRIYEKSI
jgi:ribosomal protein S18 acetylase RimI-like enzyme